jgi:hypothetical protein
MLTDNEWIEILNGHSYKKCDCNDPICELYTRKQTENPDTLYPYDTFHHSEFWTEDLTSLFGLLDDYKSYTIVKNGNYLIDRVVDKDGQVHCSQVTYPTLVEAIQRMLLQIVQTKKENI